MGWGFRSFGKPSRHPKGLTLLEVSLAMVVLTTAIMGVYSLFITSEMLATLSREESIAMYAAKGVINRMRAAPFENDTWNPATDSPESRPVWAYHNYVEPVNLAGPNAPNQRLGAIVVDGGDGDKVPQELGVQVIGMESPDESVFGDVDGDGDLDFPVDLNGNGRYDDVLTVSSPVHPFPMDLSGSASITDNLMNSLNLLRFVPVVVVVRWRSQAGMETRIQLVTFLTDRLGNL
ncbi:MAG: hypothetical protein AMXMBFR7_20960 [Planctomycetota bacterium]